jgi:uncharacterized protein YecT (DUF1311 family)
MEKGTSPMVRRSQFLTSILLCGFFGVCGGHEMSTKALCPDASTTVEMQACLGKRYEAADRALNHVYKQLMGKLEPARQEKLRAAQRAWVVFRDASAAFEASEAEGGSMYPLVHVATLVVKTELRADELKGILKRLVSN